MVTYVSHVVFFDIEISNTEYTCITLHTVDDDVVTSFTEKEMIMHITRTPNYVSRG